MTFTRWHYSIEQEILKYDDKHCAAEDKENYHYYGAVKTPVIKSMDELLKLFGTNFLSNFEDDTDKEPNTKNVTNANSTNNITNESTTITIQPNRHNNNNNNNNNNTTVPS